MDRRKVMPTSTPTEAFAATVTITTAIMAGPVLWPIARPGRITSGSQFLERILLQERWGRSLNSLDPLRHRNGITRSLKRNRRSSSTSRLLWTCSWSGSSLLSSPGIEPQRSMCSESLLSLSCRLELLNIRRLSHWLELWLLLLLLHGRSRLLLDRHSLELLKLLPLGLRLLSTPARPRLPRHMPSTS